MINIPVAKFISHHLLVAATFAFVCGIAIARQPIVLSIPPLVILLILAALVAGFLFLFFLHTSRPFRYLIIIPLFLMFGWYHCNCHLFPPQQENHLYNIVKERQDAILIGTMTTMADYDGRTSSSIIKAKLLRLEGAPLLRPVTGKILIRLAGPWPKSANPGDDLIIRATVKRPPPSNSPGAFDYASFLAEQNIWVTGFLRSPIQIKALAANGESWIDRVRYEPEKMRNQIGRWLDGHLSETLSGVYRALLIGDRSRLDEKTLELFRRTGTFHILAISGLHMSVLAFLMYGCLYWLLSRSEWLLLHISVPKTALLLTMPGLVMYGTIAGMNTPVVRALIMSCTVIFAFCLNRIKSIAPLIGFAGFLILSIEPLQLFSASFILSFSAIIAIASLYPILNQIFATKEEQLKPQKLPEKLGRWIVAAMLVSTAATVVTLPIIVNYFNRLTFLGPIANLVIEPLICLWSLPLGIIGMILIPITPHINSFFFEIGGWGFQLASWLGNLTAGLPGSELRLPAFPWWAIFGYYLGLLLLIIVRRSRYRYLGCGLAAVIAIWSINSPAMLAPSSLGGGATTISILDVGQGNAALVELPSRHRILIDGGSSSFNQLSIGEKVIAPYLFHKNIKKLDTIIVTHPDADHFNGLRFIIQHFSPNTLWVKDTLGHNEEYRQMIAFARSRHVEIFMPQSGDKIGSDLAFVQCLANFEDHAETLGQINNSLVLKVCDHDICALFPGDIEETAEGMLVDSGIDVQARILLAPHHGSATSSSGKFLEAVQPDIIFISAGKNDQRYFPNPKITSRYEQLQIAFFNTAETGSMETSLSAGQQEITAYRHIRANPLLPLEKFSLFQDIHHQMKQ